VKETNGKIGGNVTKVFNGLTKRSYIGCSLLHLHNMGQVAFTNLRSALLLAMSQDLYRLMHHPVGT